MVTVRSRFSPHRRDSPQQISQLLRCSLPFLSFLPCGSPTIPYPTVPYYSLPYSTLPYPPLPQPHTLLCTPLTLLCNSALHIPFSVYHTP